MGLTPNISPIGQRIRARNHLTEWFKDWTPNMPSSFRTLMREVLMDNYHEFYTWPTDMVPDWIDSMVALLPDDAYLLKYPQFYLPITADKPVPILLENLEAQGVLGIGWPEGFYGFYQRGGPYGQFIVINMNMCLADPREGLNTIVHEYAHKIATDADILPVPPTSIFEAIYDDLISDAGDDYDAWFVGDRSTLHSRMVESGHEPDISNFARYRGWDIKVYEIFVRMKANVALNSKYHTLSDLFRGDIDTMFTPLFQEYAAMFAWPGAPPQKVIQHDWLKVFD